jgi:hypothetical protein
MGDDARDGVAAGVVVAEDLREEAPEGRDRAEDSVAIGDAVLVEGLADAGFGQDVGEGEAVVAREARAELIQAGHGIGVGASGWQGREMSLGPASGDTYPTLAQGLRFEVRPGRGWKGGRWWCRPGHQAGAGASSSGE